MLIRVALKTDTEIIVGNPGERHDAVILRAISKKQSHDGIQGFVTDMGTFMNRYEAAQHAFECGQITNWKPGDTVISEELW
jgi:hypothetical protein